MMESLHKAYLIADAKRIAERLKLSFEIIDRNSYIVDGIKFDNTTTMLEYVYNKEKNESRKKYLQYEITRCNI